MLLKHFFFSFSVIKELLYWRSWVDIVGKYLVVSHCKTVFEGQHEFIDFIVLSETSTRDTCRALDKRKYLMIIFLFLIETICCDPSSEPSR